MKTIKLNTAIIAQIKAFVDSGKDYSAYDVTKAIRNDCNSGVLAISDLQQEDVDGISSYKIVHSDVQAYVKELEQNNLLFGCQKTYGVSHHGVSYVIYNPAPVVPTFQVAASTSTSTASTAAIAIPIKIKQSKTNKINAALSSKIENYVVNKGLKGSKATLKGIQSRLKQKGITVEDIYNFVVDDGYYVSSTEPLHLSEVY